MCRTSWQSQRPLHSRLKVRKAKEKHRKGQKYMYRSILAMSRTQLCLKLRMAQMIGLPSEKDGEETFFLGGFRE
jgi:hypothetical protein